MQFSLKLTSLIALAVALTASEASSQHVAKDTSFTSRAVKQFNVPFKPRCRPSSTTSGTTGYDVISNCVDLSTVKTIVSFGDSYTDCGKRDGTGCPPPTAPSDPLPAEGDSNAYKYGNRASNGRTWVEDLSTNLGVKLLNFASGGATVERSIIPASRVDNDLLSQYNTFRAGNFKLDRKSTLCTFWFGINDNSKVKSVSTDTAKQAELLAAAAQKELSYSDLLKDTCDQMVFIEIKGGAFGDALSSGVTSRAQKGQRLTFVSVKDLFSDFVKNASKYGFKKTTPCLVNTTDSTHWKLVCTPDETINSLYYIGGHPTGKAHEDVAEFIQTAVSSCYAQSTGVQCKASKNAAKAAKKTL